MATFETGRAAKELATPISFQVNQHITDQSIFIVVLAQYHSSSSNCQNQNGVSFDTESISKQNNEYINKAQGIGVKSNKI